MANPIVDTVQGLVQGGANVANQAGQYGETGQATTPLAPEATGQGTIGIANAIPGELGTAQTGVEKAAETEAKIATPAGQAIQGGAQQQIQTGKQQIPVAAQQYVKDVEISHQKQIAAESALNQANNNANINPQEYVQQMGLGQRTIAALGMLISGAGSGLTGQPNLAIQAFQSNIERDIAAQKQRFANQISIAAAKQGLLQTAQDKLQIDQQAQNIAGILVNSGAANMLNGAQMTIAGSTAQDLANVTKLQLAQKALESKGNYDSHYVQVINSGNSKHVNIMGLGADAASEALGGKPLGLNRNPLQHIQDIVHGASGNPAMGTTQNAIKQQEMAPAATPIQELENSKNFLDEMALKKKRLKELENKYD